MLTKPTVATKRKYNVLDVKSAKKVAAFWLQRAKLENAIEFGLPEVDDRYHIWRVPLLGKASHDRIGEVVIDAYTSLIIEDKSTRPEVLESRLLGRNGHKKRETKKQNGSYVLSSLRNTIAQGDSEELLQELPVELAEKVIRYYSFKGDVVLDPFAGIGTVGKAAVKLGRRFILIEQNPKYVSIIREEAKSWLGKEAIQVHTMNCAPIDADDVLI